MQGYREMLAAFRKRFSGVFFCYPAPGCFRSANHGNQENVDEYDLHEAWGDMLNDPQQYPFEADFLLPHQKLEFRIAIDGKGLIPGFEVGRGIVVPIPSNEHKRIAHHDCSKITDARTLIYVTPKGNQFKITTLRHWHVSTHYRLVSN